MGSNQSASICLVLSPSAHGTPSRWHIGGWSSVISCHIMSYQSPKNENNMQQCYMPFIYHDIPGMFGFAPIMGSMTTPPWHPITMAWLSLHPGEFHQLRHIFATCGDVLTTRYVGLGNYCNRRGHRTSDHEPICFSDGVLKVGVQKYISQMLLLLLLLLSPSLL